MTQIPDFSTLRSLESIARAGYLHKDRCTTCWLTSSLLCPSNGHYHQFLKPKLCVFHSKPSAYRLKKPRIFQYLQLVISCNAKKYVFQLRGEVVREGSSSLWWISYKLDSGRETRDSNEEDIKHQELHQGVPRVLSSSAAGKGWHTVLPALYCLTRCVDHEHLFPRSVESFIDLNCRQSSAKSSGACNVHGLT